ncbi:Ribosome-inactivating protein SNAI [Euphorbia peplus]|nr:Ribosome-inactivating protein SNAI [Euphorbia peplus]
MCENLVFYMDDPSPADYSKFLDDLRSNLTSYRIEKYNLPVLGARSCVDTQPYLMVDLFYNEETLTLALDVVDLNLVAFKCGNKSSFFSNTAYLKDQIFIETEIKVELAFTNLFESLGRRDSVALGMVVLHNAFTCLTSKVYVFESLIKTSLLMVIGVVCEATRFRVIEDAIISAFNASILYTVKMTSYADNWVDLSKNIQQAEDNGQFCCPVLLQIDCATTMKVTNVGQVQGKMGILIKDC